MDKLGSFLVEHKNGLVKWNGCIGPKTEENIALNVAKGENYRALTQNATFLKKNSIN